MTEWDFPSKFLPDQHRSSVDHVRSYMGTYCLSKTSPNSRLLIWLTVTLSAELRVTKWDFPGECSRDWLRSSAGHLRSWLGTFHLPKTSPDCHLFIWPTVASEQRIEPTKWDFLHGFLCDSLRSSGAHVRPCMAIFCLTKTSYDSQSPCIRGTQYVGL